MPEEQATFLPDRPTGLLLWQAGVIVQHNEDLLTVLTAHGETPEIAGRERLERLLADSLVREVIDRARLAGMARQEFPPAWWQGQILGVVAWRLPEAVLLVVQNWTVIHHLAQMQQEFVANVSHELRTPLTSIRMAAESLQLGAMSNEKLRTKFASNIQREAERLSRLVNELLVVANLHGQPTLHLGDFTLLDLAQEVISTLEPHAELNHVQLKLSVPPELPPFRGDRDRIQQVLINLVDNAIKFTPASGAVTLKLAQQAVDIVIEVSDTGIGIPEIDRPRIFDRFYRVDKSRSRVTGGVGLGLSIVKDIIVAHGGTIAVTSELNVGTTFTIRLPSLAARLGSSSKAGAR
ncbi:MAG: hypothetical protein HY692_09750 [Cyanobacteria bacterium NC_groundwater_1444_Ag_S-0.65um_54_12]|nr:hypothetical protein [Cyanobacteria bacterium NC_groundwater_1444_Ag_S-0.65um_54_12]